MSQLSEFVSKQHHQNVEELNSILYKNQEDNRKIPFLNRKGLYLVIILWQIRPFLYMYVFLPLTVIVRV
jgi:hypothetical protein